MIRIEHAFEVDGTRESVWELVGDIDAFARCVPTLVEHVADGPDRATGVVGVTLGAIPVRSRVDLEITERRPPDLLVARAVSFLGDTIAGQLRKGRPGAVAAGSVGRIDIRLELVPAGERRTRLRFLCEIDAEGKLERIYESIVRLKKQALEAELERNVAAALCRRAPAPAAAATSASRPVPTPSERGRGWSVRRLLWDIVVWLARRVLRGAAR